MREGERENKKPPTKIPQYRKNLNMHIVKEAHIVEKRLIDNSGESKICIVCVLYFQ